MGTRQRTLGKPPRSVGEEQKTVAIRRATLPNAPKNAPERRARGRVLIAVRLNRARLGARGCRLQMPERGARGRIRIDPHIHTRTPPRTQGRQPRVALPRKVVVQCKVDNQRAARHRSICRRSALAAPEQRAGQHEAEPRGCTSQERPGGQDGSDGLNGRDGRSGLQATGRAGAGRGKVCWVAFIGYTAILRAPRRRPGNSRQRGRGARSPRGGRWNHIGFRRQTKGRTIRPPKGAAWGRQAGVHPSDEIMFYQGFFAVAGLYTGTSPATVYAKSRIAYP